MGIATRMAAPSALPCALGRHLLGHIRILQTLPCQRMNPNQMLPFLSKKRSFSASKVFFHCCFLEVAFAVAAFLLKFAP